MDAAAALALGAELVGFALPVIRTVVEGGAEAVVQYFEALGRTLRSVMLLTGSRRVADLARGVTWREPGFAAAVDSFTRAEAGGGKKGGR
jgi:isopentenyl diphosphate isomerase/L-lactate dehydrogenase-like FMN-dependent dehydrogenase